MPYPCRALSCLLFVHALAAHAQPHIVLSGPATCTECRIELERVVAFGDAQGPGMLQEQATVATDRRGRFYVSSNYDPTIVVFDRRGRFLANVGRKGIGPGEINYRPTILFGARDTLYAMDLDSRRLTVFSPEYKFVRTATVAHGATYVVSTPDGGFLLAGRARSREGIDYPLHVVDSKGAGIRSFGSTTGELDLYSPTESERRLAVPRGGIVWTSRLDAYVLEQRSLDGKRLAHLTRQVPWFPPGLRISQVQNRNNPGQFKERPVPRIRAISEDSAGLVWTVSVVADRDFKPRTLPTAPSGHGWYIPDSLWHKLHDSVLEVIDPSRGQVLASRTFDTAFLEFIAPNLLVSFEEDGDGNPRYVVWRTRLVAPSR
jgi:hypothetical protein